MLKRYIIAVSVVLALLVVLATAREAKASGCEVHTSLNTRTNLTLLGVPLCDVNGAQWMSLATIISGEDLTNLLMRVSGGAVRSVTMMTGVTTNTTSAATTIFSGGKTPIAQVSGTGAVTATVKLYGDNDSTAANGILLCTITLTDTTKDVDVCTQFTADYPYYYATTESVTGTGATVEFIVASGIAGSGTSIAHDAAASTANPSLIGGYANAAAPTEVTADLDAVRAWFLRNGAQVTANIDPCSQKTKLFVAINQTTGTQLFAGTASNRTYVCQFTVISATAQNIALVSGTGTVCATATAAMLGGATAATGFNFAANGGVTIGIGAATIAKSTVDAHNICILTSGVGQLSGVLSYVSAAN